MDNPMTWGQNLEPRVYIAADGESSGPRLFVSALLLLRNDLLF